MDSYRLSYFNIVHIASNLIKLLIGRDQNVQPQFGSSLTCHQLLFLLSLSSYSTNENLDVLTFTTQHLIETPYNRYFFSGFFPYSPCACHFVLFASCSKHDRFCSFLKLMQTLHVFLKEYFSHCSLLPCSQISRSTPLSTIVTVQVCISPLICTSDQFFCDSKAWIATLPIYWTSHKITTSIDVCGDYLSIQ